MTPLVRAAVEADLAALAERRWDFRFEEDDVPPAISRAAFVESCVGFLREGLASGRWVYWIAEVEGTIVSNLFVQIVPMVPRPARPRDAWGYVTNVYTDPAHRGQAVGGALLKAVVAWARERDLERLVLWPTDASRPFYERAGFKGGDGAFELRLRPE